MPDVTRRRDTACLFRHAETAMHSERLGTETDKWRPCLVLTTAQPRSGLR